MSPTEKRSPHQRKRVNRTLVYWLVADALFVMAFAALLLYKPPGYRPVASGVDPNDPQEVHPYLTRLSSDLYNGMQAQKPFRIDLLAAGINEAILQADWPMASEGITFAAPEVRMTAQGVSVIGMASYEGVDLAVRIESIPVLTADGDLRLHVEAVRVGALNVTPLALMIARKMVKSELPWFSSAPDDERTLIARSLLEDRPFEPLFAWEDRRVRLTALILKEGSVEFTLAPE